MTNESARIILLQMLDGLDPTTGEVLPPDHLLNDATVNRALHTAVLALMDVRMPVNRNGRLNAGRAWTEMDRDALAALSRSGASMETMCEKLQRRRRGVQRQLRDMGLPLPPGEEGCHTRRHAVDGGGRGTAAKAVPSQMPGRGNGTRIGAERAGRLPSHGAAGAVWR